jgi:hypothetical protein
MLENIATQFTETKVVETVDEAGKKKKFQITYKGTETKLYQQIYNDLADAKSLINYWMNNRTVSNRQEILSRAYQILSAVKMQVLQKASEFGMDFDTKKDLNNAWLNS